MSELVSLESEQGQKLYLEEEARTELYNRVSSLLLLQPGQSR